MEIKLNSNDIRNLIAESVKEYLLEYYGGGSWSVFGDNKELCELEKLVNKFTYESIEVDNETEKIISFSDFIDGIVKLYEEATEKAEFDRLGLGKQYREAVANNMVDEFYEKISDDYQYIDIYFRFIDEWDKFMPKPEVVAQYANLFIQWLEKETEHNIEVYTQEKWSDFKYYSNYLNKNLF